MCQGKKYTFEQVIEEQGSLTYHFKGDSMEPFLNQRTDLVIIKKPATPLKPLDIVLYKRDNGQYVLHRILKCRKKDYLICGDNRWQLENGITDRHVLGIMTGVIRNGKQIPVDELADQHYLFWNCKVFWPRALRVRMKYYVRRCKSKLRRRK